MPGAAFGDGGGAAASPPSRHRRLRKMVAARRSRRNSSLRGAAFPIGDDRHGVGVVPIAATCADRRASSMEQRAVARPLTSISATPRAATRGARDAGSLAVGDDDVTRADAPQHEAVLDRHDRAVGQLKVAAHEAHRGRDHHSGRNSHVVTYTIAAMRAAISAKQLTVTFPGRGRRPAVEAAPAARPGGARRPGARGARAPNGSPKTPVARPRRSSASDRRER